MMTWKTIGKRYEWWMDVMIFLNTVGVYVYIVWFGADVTAMILLSGLNMACLTIARREELKRVLTPAKEPDEKPAMRGNKKKKDDAPKKKAKGKEKTGKRIFPKTPIRQLPKKLTILPKRISKKRKQWNLLHRKLLLLRRRRLQKTAPLNITVLPRTVRL